MKYLSPLEEAGFASSVADAEFESQILRYFAAMCTDEIRKVFKLRMTFKWPTTPLAVCRQTEACLKEHLPRLVETMIRNANKIASAACEVQESSATLDVETTYPADALGYGKGVVTYLREHLQWPAIVEVSEL